MSHSCSIPLVINDINKGHNPYFVSKIMRQCGHYTSKCSML